MELESNRRILIGAGALVLAAAAYYFLSGPRGTDEQRIRRVIDQVRIAVEERSAKTVVELLSLDYHDAEGMGRQEVRQSLVGHFFQSKASLTCLAIPRSVEVADDGRNATANVFAAVFEGGSVSGLQLPEGGDAFEIDVKLKKEANGEWRVTWHERRRISVQQVWDLATAE